MEIHKKVTYKKFIDYEKEYLIAYMRDVEKNIGDSHELREASLALLMFLKGDC